MWSEVMGVTGCGMSWGPKPEKGLGGGGEKGVDGVSEGVDILLEGEPSERELFIMNR